MFPITNNTHIYQCDKWDVICIILPQAPVISHVLAVGIILVHISDKVFFLAVLLSIHVICAVKTSLGHSDKSCLFFFFFYLFS